jgi:two-component system repressor protein LuxO
MNHPIIGQSPAFIAALAKADRAAASMARVMLTGETGTGKEVMARRIHAGSARAQKPFIALNCASLSPELMESELFGHVKGAFTTALRDHGGLVAQADGGTLFLDEIAEIAPALQAKLLRFIETGEYRRVGDAALRRADVRLMSATHRDLRAHDFRDDLYYRLAVVTIEMPPLRLREEDIPLLAEFFLGNIAQQEKRSPMRPDSAALAALQRHDWPGNIRELHNLLYHAVVMNDGALLTPAMLALPPPVDPMAMMREAAKPQPLWAVEQAAIDAAIRYCGGNIPHAARLLEVSPSTLYRRPKTRAQG